MASRGRGRPPAADAATLDTASLLDAALLAFAERGYEGTSVRELARDLDVSHNLIPQRIGSKEQLWYDAVDRGFGLLAVDLAQVAQDAGDQDDVATLRALVVGFIESNARRPALLRIINQEAAGPGPRLDYLFERYIEPVRVFGADLLARLGAAGDVRTTSVSLVYFLMTHGAGAPVALPALARRFDEVIDPEDDDALHRHAVAAADVLFDGLLRKY